MRNDYDYPPRVVYVQSDRNPGGLIGTLAAILVFLALVTATIFAIRTGLAQRILFPPAPVVVPTVQPTAAITVPTPRPLPTHPPYMPQPPAPAPAVVEQAPPVPQVVPTQAPIIIYATVPPAPQPTITGTNGWYGGYAGHWEDAQADVGAVLDVDRAPPETEAKPVNLPAGQPTATAIPADEWKCGNAPCPTPQGWGGGSGSGW